MGSFVLVHGSWHGAWCWYRVAPRLRALGHEVLVPDLPGHGRDRTPAEEIDLGSYTRAVTDAIDSASGPVVLVGHSRGGLAITQAAEERPERVRTLVYLAAYLLRDSESVLDVATSDVDSLVLPNLELDENGHWDMLREEAFDAALYADCPSEDIALAHMLLTPEPFVPSRTPMRLSSGRYGRIPRVYIELLQDRAVTLTLQRRMQEAAPCARTLSIDASHSAYFSRPDELTGHLVSVLADPELAAGSAAAPAAVSQAGA